MDKLNEGGLRLLTVPDLQHLFIHEMCHVWQRARGMNVIFRGLASWIVSYDYVLDERFLNEYPMEQQAQIIADNFILQNEGYKAWEQLWAVGKIKVNGKGNESVINGLYKHTLSGFPW